jgi:selenide,water dikinase
MAVEGKFNLLQLTERCGCGAKLPAADLGELLSSLPHSRDPCLLVGPDTLDDGAVYRLTDDCLITQSVDFFPPVAAEPEVFGRIATANALSDIYAMGGTPLTALALMCFPSGLPLQVAHRIITGALEKLTEAHVTLVGGHTLTDPQLKFGLSVTGLIESGQILTNAAAHPGDILVLTKPLGTGLTITAAKAGVAGEANIQEANRFMSALNSGAARAALEAGAHAATDVTGFGLLGHGWTVAKASRARIRFRAEAIPTLPGALEFASMGLVPAGAYANRQFLNNRARFSEGISLPRQDVLFDPQTSGGLLVSLPPENVERFREILIPLPDCCCPIVGEVEPGDEEPRILVER